IQASLYCSRLACRPPRYLSAFIVQIYFASRIHRLTEARKPLSLSALGIYIILLLSITQIVAGIIQRVWSYVSIRASLSLVYPY
ncbi:hypothetical protein R3P38DRAFT_3362836, partial [Favolaschia claudopus]